MRASLSRTEIIRVNFNVGRGESIVPGSCVFS